MRNARKYAPALAAGGAVVTLAGTVQAADDPPTGYTDTPYLPGSGWRVHDIDRPRPAVVRPAAGVFVAPPDDALVLFDGESLANWQDPDGTAPKWLQGGGTMRPPAPGTYETGKNLETRRAFGDIQLHIEWRTPAAVHSASQGRGNSGVFLMGRYEIQVLDSFDNTSYADGQAGAIYGQKPPLVNASLPPGAWQSYDIVFEAPRFGDNGELQSPAYVTVVHNGVLLHHRQAFMGPTQHRTTTSYDAHPATLPLVLQDHGNPVEFRNVWVREIDLAANDREPPSNTD